MDPEGDQLGAQSAWGGWAQGEFGSHHNYFISLLFVTASIFLPVLYFYTIAIATVRPETPRLLGLLLRFRLCRCPRTASQEDRLIWAVVSNEEACRAWEVATRCGAVAEASKISMAATQHGLQFLGTRNLKDLSHSPQRRQF